MAQETREGAEFLRSPSRSSAGREWKKKRRLASIGMTMCVRR